MSENGAWEAIVSWVDSRRDRITGWARFRMGMSAYDVEDFIQQAYISAYEAMTSGEVEKNPALFERYFWGVFKNQCRGMLTGPRLLGDVEPASKTPRPVTIRDDRLRISLEIMTPREKDVWMRLLDASNGTPTLSEIAVDLGCSRQCVQQLRDAGLRRVRDHFSSRPRPCLINK